MIEGLEKRQRQTCRICGREDIQTINIFGDVGRRKNLLSKIKYCFSKQVLNISLSDELPHGVCNDCERALCNSFSNAKKIHHLQIQLKKRFLAKETKKLNEPYQYENKEFKTKFERSLSLDKTLDDLLKDSSSSLYPSENSEEFQIPDSLMFPLTDDDEDEEKKKKNKEFGKSQNDERIFSDNCSAALTFPDGTIIQVPIINDKQVFTSSSLTNESLKSSKFRVLLSCHGASTLKCTLCNVKFKTSETRQLFNHCRIVHDSQNIGYQCPVCSIVYSQVQDTETHMRIHVKSHLQINENPKTMNCEQCPKLNFSSSKALKSHLETVHFAAGLHECTICSRMFSCRSSLKRHSYIHSGVRPYNCPLCQATFNQKSILSTHMKVHRFSKSTV